MRNAKMTDMSNLSMNFTPHELTQISAGSFDELLERARQTLSDDEMKPWWAERRRREAGMREEANAALADALGALRVDLPEFIETLWAGDDEMEAVELERANGRIVAHLTLGQIGRVKGFIESSWGDAEAGCWADDDSMETFKRDIKNQLGAMREASAILDALS